MPNFFRLLAALPLLASYLVGGASAAAGEPLRVQLLWEHQSQFAGFYVAQARRHFEAQGLKVELLEGGPGINPIRSLQSGEADVAVAWLGDAWRHSTAEAPVVNVAQLFSGSSMAVVCRISSGVVVPADIRGKRIGYWGLGDDRLIEEMLLRLDIPLASVELVEQRPHGEQLISGELPCGSAMLYNEYWTMLEAGVPPSDLVVIEPELFGIPHVEDGLYVRRDRLASADFRRQLVGLVRALRQGWHEARVAPTLAVESVMRMNPQLDRDQQRHMLETVLDALPPMERFGLLDLARYERAVNGWLTDVERDERPPQLWTHQVWNRLLATEERATPLTDATLHYSARVLTHPAFEGFVLFGVLVFALSGALEAIRRDYDLWGRLILAFLSGIGGGTLRDLLIGGDRIPFYYVREVAYPLGILLVVLGASLVKALYRHVDDTRAYKTVKSYADIIGFSVLATSGAQIALGHGMPWYWAPVCAALSCAGGGMLRAIVINQEPFTFKGEIFEEVAVVGALVFVAGLFIADHFEATPWPVYLSVAASVLSIAAMRWSVYRYGLRYPRRGFWYKSSEAGVQPGAG